MSGKMSEKRGNIKRKLTLITIAFIITTLLAPAAYAAGASAYSKHKVSFERINNARDFGGYRTKSGKIVKKNIFIRSAELSFATKADMKKLKKRYRLKRVFDFRHPNDYKYCPDRRIKGVTYTCLPIEYKGKRKASTAKKRYRTMKKYSRSKLRLTGAKKAKCAGKTYAKKIVLSRYSQKQYRKYFNYLLANKNKNGVLIHCVHGKDRTGVAAFMTLIALGVPEKTAYREYTMTNDWIKSVSPKTYRKYRVGVRASELKYAVNKAKKKYGSMNRFLEKAYGLDSKDRKKLRRMYTE